MTAESGEHAVEALYSDYQALLEDLSRLPSALASINRAYHKHLLVAAASSLEDVTKVHVAELFRKYGNDRISGFVANQVMSRGYHTLFDWKNQTAQGFFTYFGKDCGTAFKASVKADANLKIQHDAFMSLGNLRNQLVHNNFAGFSIDLTPQEVMEKYRLGRAFIETFEGLIFLYTPSEVTA